MQSRDTFTSDIALLRLETNQLKEENLTGDNNTLEAVKVYDKESATFDINGEYYSGEINDEFELGNNKLKKITMTKTRTSEVRKYWREYKGENGHGDWKKLSDELDGFLEDKTESNNTELEGFDEEKLKL
ncbi:hypothetical protein HRED_03779, partial [Candidatus Haloredivivus sp. G17]